MQIHVTSRHFKAQESLVEHAEEAVEQLTHYYDGIIKAEVILSFEKARNRVKSAEVRATVYNAVLTSIVTSDDFKKSIDSAIAKVLVQLKKYKDKLHSKDRIAVRRVRLKA